MPRILAAVFTVILLLHSHVEAQVPCTRLAGVVMDSTGALIPGATIALDEKTDRLSGQDGRFAFPCVNAGHHSLTATYHDFAAFTVRVTAPHAGDGNAGQHHGQCG